MHLGIRILFGFFLITGLAGFFVLRIFVAEIKPSVREVMEDMMVDTANILAEVAADDLHSGTMAQGRFARQVGAYARRPIDARIWGLDKQTLDFRVYVTDVRGTVVFDSSSAAVGQDYSQWRDVARTLRGEYGTRATREVQQDDRTSVLYVAAPVKHGDQVIGVLTVAKPVSTVQAFIDRAERKMLVSGLWLLGLSAAVGVVVTLWVVLSIRRLRRYANATEAGKKLPLPRIAGELGDLARAMQAMRQRVEGRDYIEGYVRALTHELESPLAAIRGAGELLQEPLPEADLRHRETDDTALKVCLLFNAPAENLSALEQGLLGVARAISGEKLPAATLCYVWDNTLPVGTVLNNAFTGRIRMIVVDSGTKALGQWVSHQQDVAADFRRAFGREFPTLPPLEGVAVGADADNTGGHSVGFVGDVTLSP